MEDTVSIAPGCEHLDQGTYWIVWATSGSLPSGPWVPPITILDHKTTGNALQTLDYGVSWTALVDAGTLTPQGLPFVIEGSSAGYDIPWLSEDPTSGPIQPGECTIVDVTFDSTALDPGIYEGTLNVNSNDPDTPLVSIPVTLTVNPAVRYYYLPIVYK
jgi:hypothetical protein